MMAAALRLAPAFLAPRPCRVLARRRESRDTVTLQLEADGWTWRPGQFTMLSAFGTGEVPISISGDPARPDRVVHTVRDVGLATAAVCRLRAGEWAGVRGPFGSSWPLDEAPGRDVLVIAGGLGMAPLRPVVHALLGRPREEGELRVLYGARTPGDVLYLPQLRRWAARGALDLRLTVDAGGASWHGEVGVVPALLRHVAVDPARTIAMVCGPEVMMRFTIARLRDLGLADTAIWISMERNMHCGVGLCGHCQLGPVFVCREGPVFRLDAVAWLLGLREV
jgi:NAD(P)H-flavin reductase